MRSSARAERHGLALRLLYPLIWLLAWLLVGILGGLRVRHRGRVPRGGGLLVLANHLADLDPVVIQIACPRLVHFMAKSELFAMPVLGRVIRFFRAFPVRRGEPDKASIRLASDLIRDGEAVCIFPEGELSETGALQPLLPGAALIARLGGGSVVCCGVRGTQRMLPYGRVVPKLAFRAAEVAWGTARQAKDFESAEKLLEWAEGELRALTGQA